MKLWSAVRWHMAGTNLEGRASMWMDLKDTHQGPGARGRSLGYWQRCICQVSIIEMFKAGVKPNQAPWWADSLSSLLNVIVVFIFKR